MSIWSARIPYRQTGFFSDLVLDYLDHKPSLDSFYAHRVSLKGIEAAIAEQKKVPIDRNTLTKALRDQYEGLSVSQKLQLNLERLSKENCFTVTTAHQNNLFTGPLYFIYKILHVIKLADHLEQSNTGDHFVPVFYMGAEDADLAELDHANIDGVRYQWKTDQTGAVGRMILDEQIITLQKQIEIQLGGLPHVESLITLLRNAYQPGKTMAEATFSLVNAIFGKYGLVVVMPDNSMLKASFRKVMTDELLEGRASMLAEKAAQKLQQAGYQVQAKPRAINLFYLTEGVRERIEKEGDYWVVKNTSFRFDRAGLLNELETHPERFSPNVILRGLYQCKMLPDVAFVGGGGELAYWLEFRDLFAHYKVPMPVLILRNSFLLLESSKKEILNKLLLTAEDLFVDEATLAAKLLSKEETELADINKEKDTIREVYAQLLKKANAVDPSLTKHVAALEKKTGNGLEGLEKKLLRALKKKHSTEQYQLLTLKQHLFPGGQLQERQENILYYLAKYGHEIIDALLEHSLSLEQEFTLCELA